MEDSQLWEEEEESSDAARLTELLEEEETAADDDSRLRSAIRSLEAEISTCGGDDAMLLNSVHHHEDCEDCRMDDILAGVDSLGSGCSTSAAMAPHVEESEEPVGWVDMADWYVDECIDELMAANYGELRGQYCGASDEQFCSLWDL